MGIETDKRDVSELNGNLRKGFKTPVTWVLNVQAAARYGTWSRLVGTNEACWRAAA